MPSGPQPPDDCSMEIDTDDRSKPAFSSAGQYHGNVANAKASEDNALERGLTTSERYRNRSWSLAGLCATGAGALAAGLVFAPTGSSLSDRALIAGGAGFACLLAAVFLNGYALIVTKPPKGVSDTWPKGEPKESANSRLLTSIRRATGLGATVASVALVSLALMGAFVFLDRSETMGVSVVVNQEALDAIHIFCPTVSNPIEGTSTVSNVHSDSLTLSLNIESPACSSQGNTSSTPTNLLIRRDQITAIETAVG